MNKLTKAESRVLRIHDRLCTHIDWVYNDTNAWRRWSRVLDALVEKHSAVFDRVDALQAQGDVCNADGVLVRNRIVSNAGGFSIRFQAERTSIINITD